MKARFGEQIAFHRLARRNTSEFIFRAAVNKGNLIERCAKADTQLEENETERLTTAEIIDPDADLEPSIPAAPVGELYRAAFFLRKEV